MANILPLAETQFVDANGVPLAGGSVYFYIPGTSTPKDTYQNSTASVLNTNPVVLDSAGRAIIWGNGQYRQVVLDSIGNTIWDQITSTLDTSNSYANSTAARAISTTTYAMIFITSADGGWFYRDSSDKTSVEDGGSYCGTVIRSADYAANGVWKRSPNFTRYRPEWYGPVGTSNDSAPFQACLSAGPLYSKPASLEGAAGTTYTIKGITINGNDVDIYIPDSYVVNVAADSTSMFLLGGSSDVERMKFFAHNIQIGVGGGRIFDFVGNMNHSVINVDYIVQNETSRPIIHHSDTNFDFNTIKGKWWRITTSHTVPAIDLSSTSNKISANDFAIDLVDRSGTVPFMKIINTSVSDFNYNNYIRLKRTEVCDGGVLALGRAMNTDIDGPHCFDNTSSPGISNPIIELGFNSHLCQNTKIRNYQRNAGTLNGGTYDIMLTSSIGTYIEYPWGVSSGTKISINCNNQHETFMLGGAIANNCTVTGLLASDGTQISSYATITHGISTPWSGNAYTIATGVVTLPGPGIYHIDTEAAAASDDLDTIAITSGSWAEGDVVEIRTVNSARTVVIKNGTGNIFNGADFSENNIKDYAMFRFDSGINGFIAKAAGANNA